MLRRLIGEDVRIMVKLDPALAPVRVDPGQIEQVIINLCVNARDAMPAGGNLTIQTQNVILDESYPRAHADVRPGDYSMLSVTDIATALYYTGIDAFTKKPVQVAKGMRDRKMQRALMQFFKPENWFTVREALIEAKRTDLIGDGCDCLIPANPPKEALEKRRREAQRAAEGDHYHTLANPAKGEKPGERGAGPTKPADYRPGRKSQKRRDGKRKNGS